jgi:8-oxo-dGTP pyrophosphatase MutT (NUDIX family)
MNDLLVREAAVLVPLFFKAGVPHVLFTKRPTHLRQHGGQISFPGGGREAADQTLLHTALRETDEELGVHPSQVEVLGTLDEVPSITDFRVTPYVGSIAEARWRPSPDEVAELIEVPLRSLLDPSAARVERRLFRGAEHDVHFFDYGLHVIWGVTGRIVRNLLDVAGDLPAWKEWLKA